MSRLVAALVFVAAAACGPSEMEIKTAKTATYSAEPRAIFEIAEHAALEEYKLGVTDDVGLQFSTEPRFYAANGDLESPGAGGFVQMRPGSVQVTFIVQVLAAGDHRFAVRVIPKTFQLVNGSPKPRELAPDDPYLPPWVLGRADALSYRIYTMAHGSAAPPPA